MRLVCNRMSQCVHTVTNSAACKLSMDVSIDIVGTDQVPRVVSIVLRCWEGGKVCSCAQSNYSESEQYFH